MKSIRMTAIDEGASVAAQLCSSEGEPLVLEGVRATATIQDLLAEVTVAQRYRNDEPRNIEAVYTFPVPVDAVLLGFEVELGERTLVGRVTAKADAARDYENAMSDGDTAVLLEEAGRGLYAVNLGNLLAGESAVLRIRYGLLLRWNGDRVRVMLPTTIAPRYGDPLGAGLEPQQVPEHSFGVERGFALDVTVRGLLHGADFRSPSHSVCVTHAEHETRIALQGEPLMDRDFVIEARAERREPSGAKVAKDGNGWVALASFRPNIGEDDATRQRRAITVVVDCSGSMAGDSIAQAKVALERILDGIRPGDGLEIVAFGSVHKPLFGSVMPVNEQTLAQARRFVRRLDADLGGTELARALDAAYTTACSVQAVAPSPLHRGGGEQRRRGRRAPARGGDRRRLRARVAARGHGCSHPSPLPAHVRATREARTGALARCAHARRSRPDRDGVRRRYAPRVCVVRRGAAGRGCARARARGRAHGPARGAHRGVRGVARHAARVRGGARADARADGRCAASGRDPGRSRGGVRARRGVPAREPVDELPRRARAR